MSLHTLTIDQLMQLDLPTLRYALRLFQQELAGTLALLVQEEGARQDEQVLDDLNHVLTLRKVFTLRLAELEAEPAPPRRLPAPGSLASERYRQNELEPVS